jgi:hypothetical protein
LRLFASASARCFAVAVCFGLILGLDDFGFAALALALPDERRLFGAGLAFGFAAFLGLEAGFALLFGGDFAGASDPEERRRGALVTFGSPLPAASAAAASSATLSAVGVSSSSEGVFAAVPFPLPFSDSTTSATALTRSPFFRFISRTPWVARPIREIPSTAFRYTIPFWEMKISS